MKPAPGWRITTFSRIISVGLVTALAATLIVSVLAYRNAESVKQTWNDFERVASQKTLLLSQIRGLLGYDGVIHHYMDFILKGNRYDVIAVNDRLQQLSIALTAYRSLGMTREEEGHFLVLHISLSHYRRLIAEAEEAMDSGMTPRSIDANLPSLGNSATIALAGLDRIVTSTHQRNSETISHSLDQISLFAATAGMALVILLAGLTAATVLFTRFGLVRPLRKLVQDFRSIDAGNPGDRRLQVDRAARGNEIGELAIAGNGFLDALQSHVEQRETTLSELEVARSEAEAASKAKTRFLSQMSHELRTPLNAIIGLTDLTLRTDLTDEQKSYLRNVSNSGSHLLNMIGDIIEFTEIDEGRITLVTESFPIGKLIEDLFATLQTSAEAKGLRCLLSTSGTIPARILGDEARMGRILQSVMANALKFTHKGEIGVSVSCRHEAGQRLLSIAVSDTGIGISKEQLADLFQPFRQGDQSDSRAHEGAGLGLTIAHRIVSAMGGRISAESNPATGSRFMIELPVVAESEEVWTPASQTEQPASGDGPEGKVRGKVLLVEDNEINRMIAEEILGQEGFEVEASENGLLAVEKLQSAGEGAFCLVLMDIQMPVMDGKTATRKIRQELGMKELPILAMTAHTQAEEKLACLDAGMNDYLTKPVNRKSVARALTAWTAPDGARDTALSDEDLEQPVESTGNDFDIDAVTERLSLPEDTVRHLLIRFVEDYADAPDQIDGMIAGNRIEEARRFAHSVKGVSLSLGLDRAGNTAASLEMGLRDEDAAPDPALASDFRQDMEATLSALRDWLDGS